MTGRRPRVEDCLPEETTTTARIVSLAVENIPGCAMCSVTSGDVTGMHSAASSEPLAETVDLWQYELDEGPCLDAMNGHGTSACR